MKKFHKKIVEYGFVQIKNGKTRYNKRVKLLNYYALIWFYLSIFFHISDIIAGIYEQRSLIGHIIKAHNMIALITVIFLNSKHYYSLAKFLFIYTAFVAINTSSILISPGLFSEYFLFLIPGFALSLYDKKSISLLCLLGVVICFFIPYHIPGIYTSDIIKRIDYPATIGLFLALYFLINYFKKLNTQNEHLLALERDKVLSDKMILEQQEKKLRELDELKSHFFINLSHEIRTPLTLIKGYHSQLNKRNFAEEDTTKLRVIEEQVINMQSIIDNIMDLGKLEANELSLNISFLDINNFLNKLVTNFKPLYDNKGVSLHYESHIQNITVALDSNLFEKAISNLLSNALKFTTKEEKVIIELDNNDNGIYINISDTGIGISNENIPRLFDRFYQVKNHITKSQGSGIGLAFVKSIIDHHNFEINVDSKLGVGSQFIIEIPKSFIKNVSNSKNIESENYSKEQESPKISSIKPKVSYERKKVLIVDDHKQMRTYIKSVLSHYEIIEAENGKEALELLKTISFDLIVTDYMMPVMDGEALVIAIKTQGLEIPIIILTARTDTKGKLKMLRLGIDNYINKPFLEEELKLQSENSIKSYDFLRSFKSKLPQSEKILITKQATKFNNNLKEYINNQISNPDFKVNDVAYHFNISNRTLNRKSKALLGKTIQELILEARLIRVKELLEEDPDYTKSEITNLVGLKNSSYLFQKYEARFGIESY